MRRILLHKVPQDKTCQTKLIIQPNRFNRIVPSTNHPFFFPSISSSTNQKMYKINLMSFKSWYYKTECVISLWSSPTAGCLTEIKIHPLSLAPGGREYNIQPEYFLMIPIKSQIQNVLSMQTWKLFGSSELSEWLSRLNQRNLSLWLLFYFPL